MCGDDIEDEVDTRQAPSMQVSAGANDMMLDAMEREEDAMLSLYEAQVSSQQQAAPRPPSPSFDDDGEYDSLFMDLLSPSDHDTHDAHMSSLMDLS